MTVTDPVTELDARFSDPAAVATPWDEIGSSARSSRIIGR
jgi:hypothetical protein